MKYVVLLKDIERQDLPTIPSGTILVVTDETDDFITVKDLEDTFGMYLVAGDYIPINSPFG